MYVYIRSEPTLYTVGFYKPDGAWEPESDHRIREDAARRVAHLNGSSGPHNPEPADHISTSCSFDQIGEALDELDDGRITVEEFVERVREQVGEHPDDPFVPHQPACVHGRPLSERCPGCELAKVGL